MKLKCTKLRFLLFALFIFNSLLLYINFSTDHDHQLPTSFPRSLSESSLSHLRSSLKPWPILPSYLPWSLGGKSPIFHSCEAYFGNGFTRRVDLLKPVSEPRRVTGSRGGWFRCFYSETLRSSICEGSRIRMIPGKILMSQGGEKLESVIGRGEDEEMPKFEDGAFEIEVGDRSRVGKKLVDEEFLNRYVQQGGIERHSMRALIGSIREVDAAEFVCNEVAFCSIFVCE